MIKFATDCSGVGAPEQAMLNLGVEFRNVFACERDKYALIKYAYNHAPETFYDDITTRNNEGIEQLDIYVAGYPCQAFSNSGKKNGENDVRGTIFYHGLEFLRKNRPRAFVLENVPGMLNVKGVNILEKWLDLLAVTVNGQSRMFANAESLGYHCHWTILNTVDFGIPQNRERVFIVGLRDAADTFRFPVGFPLKTRLKDILETDVAEKYYLSEAALARIIRRNDFLPQINPQITGTINTKNNSGQLSVDNGTTLIISDRGSGSTFICKEEIVGALGARNGCSHDHSVVVNNNGTLEVNAVVNCIDANYAKGMDNHSQRSFVVQEATKKGFDVAQEGDSINLSNPESKTRRGRVGKQIANTLETSCNQAVVEPAIIQRERGFNEGGLFDVCPTITINSFEHNNHVVEDKDSFILGYTRDRITGEVIKRSKNDISLTLHTATGGGGNTDQFVVEPTLKQTLQTYSKILVLITSFVTFVEKNYGTKDKGNTTTILQAMFKEIGKEAITEWGLTSINSLQQNGILQSGMYEESIHRKREEAEQSCNYTNEQEQSIKLITGRTLRNLWKKECNRCSPQRRESIKQLIRQSSKTLQELSHENTSTTEAMFGAWLHEAAQKEGILRKTFAEICKIWNPVRIQGKPIFPGNNSCRIRRLTEREVFRLQGFPDTFKIDCVSGTQRYRQAGNSMSVCVIQAVIKNILQGRVTWN